MQREIIYTMLKENVVNDILFNIIFGRLTATDIRYFTSASGKLGLNLAILYITATEGFDNYTDLSKRIGVSTGTIRERLTFLVVGGFLAKHAQGVLYWVSLKGRIFLEILRRFLLEAKKQYNSPALTDELSYIMDKLGLEVVPQKATTAVEWQYIIDGRGFPIDQVEMIIEKWTPKPPVSLFPRIRSLDGTSDVTFEDTLAPHTVYARLIQEIHFAKDSWGVHLTKAIKFKTIP